MSYTQQIGNNCAWQVNRLSSLLREPFEPLTFLVVSLMEAWASFIIAGCAVRIEVAMAEAFRRKSQPLIFAAAVLAAFGVTACSKTESNNSKAAAQEQAAARQLMDKGDYRQAITHLNKAIELQPDGAEHYATRAAAEHSIGDDASAISDASRVLSIDPRLGSAYRNRASYELSAGKYEDAVADCNAALAISGDADAEAKQIKLKAQSQIK